MATRHYQSCSYTDRIPCHRLLRPAVFHNCARVRWGLAGLFGQWPVVPSGTARYFRRGSACRMGLSGYSPSARQWRGMDHVDCDVVTDIFVRYLGLSGRHPDMVDGITVIEKAQQIEFRSRITCPECQHSTTESMPDNACQWFYECTGCGALLKPKQGDCCVYCSFGTVPCPPIQAGDGCCTK